MKRSIPLSDRAALNSDLLRRPVRRWAALFLLPTFAAFCIAFLYPFLQGLYLSFCSFRLIRDARWVGLANYADALSDPSFLHAFRFTALFTAVSLLLVNVIAFFIAYALTQGIRGSNVFRAVFFLPNLIGGIVLGYLWSTIFDGILARFDTAVVLESRWGFWGLIVLLCWQQVGYLMIIYIAGFQAIPEDMLEAARIDGATRSQTLRHVTIPNMMPAFTICTFLSLTNGFKLYDQNLALTAGRPFLQESGTVIRTTEMLALNIVNAFYSNVTSRGPGQAKAVLFFLLVAVLSLAQLRLTRSREVQQ